MINVQIKCHKFFLQRPLVSGGQHLQYVKFSFYIISVASSLIWAVGCDVSMVQSLIRVTDRRCAEKPHPLVWHLSVRCFRTCSLSACLLSSSRRSCSISSYLLLCSRSCCFLSSRSRRCCCRRKPFYTTTPQLSACPCVCVCVRQACFPGVWMSWGANKQVWCVSHAGKVIL